MIEKDPNKLDRSRHYGTVYGDPNVGFFQDNRGFKHDGTLYVPPDGKQPERPEDVPRETLRLRTDRLREAFNRVVTSKELE